MDDVERLEVRRLRLSNEVALTLFQVQICRWDETRTEEGNILR
jgi:hypothetical protein